MGGPARRVGRTVRTSAETATNSPGEVSDWIATLVGIWLATLVGIWLAISPFVLTGAITTGATMWSTVAGILALVRAAYTGYALHPNRYRVPVNYSAGRWPGGVTPASEATWPAWMPQLYHYYRRLF